MDRRRNPGGRERGAEMMRQLAGASQLTVQSETSDGDMFTARFALDRAAEVVRRLFDACGVP